MVNVGLVKRQLPCLLLDGDTGKRENNNSFMGNRYRLQQFIKRNPDRSNTLDNELISMIVCGKNYFFIVVDGSDPNLHTYIDTLHNKIF